MKSLIVGIVVLLIQTCTLLEPHRQVQLLEPLDFGHLDDSFQEIRVEVFSTMGGNPRSYEYARGQSIWVEVEKDCLNFVLAFPQGTMDPFDPYPAGAIIDPMLEGPFSLSWEGGALATLALRNRCYASGREFNYPRLLELFQERAGRQVWSLDLASLEEKILAENFSSRNVTLPQEVEFCLDLGPGRWICEDPRWSNLDLAEGENLSLSLLPQRGLRFYHLERKELVELYRNGDGRYLVMRRTLSVP